MTVLSETTFRHITPSGIFVLIIALMFLVLAILALTDLEYPCAFYFITVCIILIAAYFIVFTEPHRRLKVILSEDYPAVDLLEKYDIKDRDGDIWVLDEKTPMEDQES